VGDIQTSVAITAQTDGLQSGMEAAADAVGAATRAMKAQFADLGAAAQQAQAQLNAAAGQIGATIGGLQTKAANLASSAAGRRSSGDSSDIAEQFRGISVREQASGSGSPDPASRLQAWRAELQGQLTEEQSFYGESKAQELAFWQDKLSLTAAGSKEQLAVENNIYQLGKQLALQKEHDTLASLAAQEQGADAVYARKKTAIEEEAALGEIAASEEVAQLNEALDSQWSLEQDYYQKKLAASENDAQTQQKLTDQQDVAYQKYLSDKNKIDMQAVQNSQRTWQSLVQPIQRTLDTSVTGIIMGTTTVQKALSNLAQSVVGEFVNSAVGSVLGGLGKSLGASLVGGGGSGGNQDFANGVVGAGQDVVGGGISEGLFGALGLGTLFSGDGLFGNLFKGIGALFSFEQGGIVPSAAGGWMVPNTSLAMLHTNEMVLPANISQGLQTMIAGGGNAAPNVTFAVSAMDSQSVAAFFKNNGATLVAALNQAMRNGSMLRTA
jgi:hypothetical protein